MGYLWYNPLGFTNTGLFVEFPDDKAAVIEDLVAECGSPYIHVYTGKTPNRFDVIGWQDRGRIDGYWYAQQYGDPS
ncbi:MAG: hypothetical protein F8N15_00395 [Methanobacterium sp.]|nr:hypothetical protein [Methanobacterium sp.]